MRVHWCRLYFLWAILSLAFHHQLYAQGEGTATDAAEQIRAQAVRTELEVSIFLTRLQFAQFLLIRTEEGPLQQLPESKIKTLYFDFFNADLGELLDRIGFRVRLRVSGKTVTVTIKDKALNLVTGDKGVDGPKNLPVKERIEFEGVFIFPNSRYANAFLEEHLLTLLNSTKTLKLDALISAMNNPKDLAGRPDFISQAETPPILGLKHLWSQLSRASALVKGFPLLSFDHIPFFAETSTRIQKGTLSIPGVGKVSLEAETTFYRDINGAVQTQNSFETEAPLNFKLKMAEEIAQASEAEKKEIKNIYKQKFSDSVLGFLSKKLNIPQATLVAQPADGKTSLAQMLARESFEKVQKKRLEKNKSTSPFFPITNKCHAAIIFL